MGIDRNKGRVTTRFSQFILIDDLEAKNNELQAKYRAIEKKETRFEAMETDDAEVVIVAFGTCIVFVVMSFVRLESRVLKLA